MSAPGFEYFDWTQSGAPLLYAQTGSLLPVLDWVLVSKGGWDKTFTGSNKATYRSQTGNRFTLRVDDRDAANSALRGYQAMTNVDTGTFPFPNTPQLGGVLWGCRKGQSSSPVIQRKYWGIRTNRYLVLVLEYYTPGTADGYTLKQWVVFGDAPSMAESDSFCTVLLGGNTATECTLRDLGRYDAYLAQNFYGAPTRGAIAASPNGSIQSPNCQLIYPWADWTGGNPSSGYDMGGRTVFAPLYWMNNPYNTSATGAAYVRARFPNVQQMATGILFPGATPGGTYQVGQVPFSVGSRTFLPLVGWAYAGDTPTTDGALRAAWLLEKTDTDGCL